MGKIMFNGESYTGGTGDDFHTYSTTEHVVGTWIDGSTIYECSYVFETEILVLVISAYGHYEDK